MVLNLLAETGKKLSELVAELPAYHIVKDKYTVAPQRLPALYEALRSYWPGGAANTAGRPAAGLARSLGPRQAEQHGADRARHCRGARAGTGGRIMPGSGGIAAGEERGWVAQLRNRGLPPARLLAYLGDRRAVVAKKDRAIARCVQRLGAVDAELFINRRGVVFRRVRLVDDVAALLVAAADDLPAGNAGPGEDDRVGVGPVIAALELVQPSASGRTR